MSRDKVELKLSVMICQERLSTNTFFLHSLKRAPDELPGFLIFVYHSSGPLLLSDHFPCPHEFCSSYHLPFSFNVDVKVHLL